MSSDSSPDQPKRRGRKSIPDDQKKRIYNIKCPHCSECFEFYHGMKDLKPPPITNPEMSAKEKNRLYQKRYKDRQKNKINTTNIVLE